MLSTVNCLRFEANMVFFFHNIIEIKLMINSSWAIILLFKIISSLQYLKCRIVSMINFG